MSEILGILGGLGPLASAAFMETLYDYNLGSREQNAPTCVLYSDPSIPDRTEAIISGQEGPVRARLQELLGRLRELGCQRIVIACLTMHHFLDHLPPHLKRGLIPLVDLIIDEVSSSPGQYLMLCSSGTRQARVFQEHPRWAAIQGSVVFPSDEDQRLIHETIYTRLKTNRLDAGVADRLLHLMRTNGVQGYIAGCTEIHLLTRFLLQRNRDAPECQIIDPLLSVAKNFRRLMHA